MEPQENKQLALRKAINAHEQAEAALGDLMKEGPDPRYEQMVERIRQNLDGLRTTAEGTGPAERV